MTDTAKSFLSFSFYFFLVCWFFWSRQKKKGHFLTEQEKKRLALSGRWRDQGREGGWRGVKWRLWQITFKSSPCAISMFISQPGIGSAWLVSSGSGKTNLGGSAFQINAPPPQKKPGFQTNEAYMKFPHLAQAICKLSCLQLYVCERACVHTNIFLFTASVFSSDSPPYLHKSLDNAPPYLPLFSSPFLNKSHSSTNYFTHIHTHTHTHTEWRRMHGAAARLCTVELSCLSISYTSD